MNTYKSELRMITEVLLKAEDNFAELKEATDRLYELFINISDFKSDDDQNREDIYVSKGKAIAPKWAAMCIKEMLRTKRFIRGFYLGIRSVLKKFPNRPIHILYAGTGPFATLAIPLTTFFTSDEINFTFLEINQNSIKQLKKIIKAFEVGDYVQQIVQCDAVNYKVDQPIQMIITETMQNALQKEPHVGITLNLVPQLDPEGILIPQNIKIEAALLDPKRNMDRMMGLNNDSEICYFLLKNIFELNKDVVEKYSINEEGLYNFSNVEIDIPKELTEEYKELSLLTTIQIFEEEVLTHWQCSLNLPQKILDFDLIKESVNRVSFQYQMSEKPGFKFEIK
ncbi:MAG: hypothetical protein KAX49_03450 [Halanaerobiales bacterium]|nr:hypothetical protein [Halanaerobiales bacterium]